LAVVLETMPRRKKRNDLLPIIIPSSYQKMTFEHVAWLV
jgi:hypothetical protein